MDYSLLAILVVVTTNVADCDWVEIPQSASLENEKATKLPDITSYILTTTSTTIPTPILAKPTSSENRKAQRVTTKSNKTTMTIDTSRTPIEPRIKNKTKQIAKHNVNTTIINDTIRNNSPNNDGDDVEVDDEDSYEENENVEESNNNHKGNDEYGYSYASFIPYMSTIQSTLMKNAHKNKKSKVSVLKNLRDHLLTEISSRMISLWKPSSAGREAREYKDEHVDFPSNEGALMTIGFLTFAVFLIKLVLQLIQTISHKMETTNTDATFIGRKRRSAMIDGESIKILNYIEQYSLK